MFVDGGFAQVVGNALTILTEQAVPAAKIDRRAAEEALKNARAMKIHDEASLMTRNNAIRRAQTQLALAQS